MIQFSENLIKEEDRKFLQKELKLCQKIYGIRVRSKCKW